jgi:hypothetical protein
MGSINLFHDSLEDLWITVGARDDYDPTIIPALKQRLHVLLFSHEQTPATDPANPFQRFAQGSLSSRRDRLAEALRSFDVSGAETILALMFDLGATIECDAITQVLHRYRLYCRHVLSDGSDDSDDSDGSDDESSDSDD